MSIYIQLIERFHEDIMARQGLAAKSPDNLDGRIDKLREELEEFASAETELERFSELVDLLYVVLGTAEVMDWPIFEGLEEIHRANMTKEFHPVRPLKGEDFVPANLSFLLAASKDRPNNSTFIDETMQGRKRRAENRRRVEENLRQGASEGPKSERLEERNDERAANTDDQNRPAL